MFSVSRRAWAVAAAVTASIAVVTAVVWPRPLLSEDFAGPDRLLANEYGFYNPDAPGAVRSRTWELTSGSAFVDAGSGWTGRPDARAPDPASRRSTNSDVFRMRTVRDDFADVSVDLRLRVERYRGPHPSTAWDGVHLLVRYRSERWLYLVSVQRRDGTVAIKKKVPGGATNGGRYYTLAARRAPLPIARWHRVSVRVRDASEGAVDLLLLVDGEAVLRARDRGVGGRPLRGPGRLALRGDRCEFRMDDIVVRPI